MSLPTVAIIGRTNVGKSTLFNRFVEEKQAIVSDIAGTTRDRNIGICHWQDADFIIVDSGGLDISYLPHTKIPKNLVKKMPQISEIEADIIKQTERALKEADLVLFMVDGKVGIMPEDRTVLNLIRKRHKPYLFVVNKIDRGDERARATEWSRLGKEKAIFISANNGIGCGDLLDEVVVRLRQKGCVATESSDEKKEIRVAIVGKPNVGKSSLLNAIAKEERVIVSPIPHTTRESHDTLITFGDRLIRIIDTAGLRKKPKTSGTLERLGMHKTLLTIKHADVVLFMIDITDPLSLQDSKIIDLINQSLTSLIIVANKWDLVPEKTPSSITHLRSAWRQYFSFLPSSVPIESVSAKTGSGVMKLLDRVVEAYDFRFHELNAEELREFLRQVIKHHPLRSRTQKNPPKIFELKQIGINPPSFSLVVEDSEQIPKFYLRYIENQLYEQFKFTGAPIQIKLKSMR